MSEANKALVARFVEEFWSNGNLAAADELWPLTSSSTSQRLAGSRTSKRSTLAHPSRLPRLVFQRRGVDRGGRPGCRALDGTGDPPRRVPGHPAHRKTGSGARRGLLSRPGGQDREFRGSFDMLSMLQQLGVSRLPASAAR